ncbi:hypothetical protein SMSP1_01628 [Sedimentisphaera salicampi]|nr:hypothetical protein SMSP1_01628 [Sedimentisphaera salicampi]
MFKFIGTSLCERQLTRYMLRLVCDGHLLSTYSVPPAAGLHAWLGLNISIVKSLRNTNGNQSSKWSPPKAENTRIDS